MATYLLTWKPKLYDPWIENIHDSIAELSENGFCKYSWSTGSNKSVKPNDRVFMMKLGENPGIIASGWAVSKVYTDRHWNRNAISKTAKYVDVHFDAILNPEIDKPFSKPLLREGVFQKQKTWTPQSSGMNIFDDIAEQLERDWAKYLKQPPVRQISYTDEIDTEKTYQEGAPKKITTTVYERNPVARAICIRFYGAVCSVCNFDFSKQYGELGKGFIHVHHLQPRAAIEKSNKLNPTRDLRPVCANCHAMLHQRKPIYSIEELKAIIKKDAKYTGEESL